MCGTPFLLRSSSLGRELDPLDIIYSRSLGFLSYRGKLQEHTKHYRYLCRQVSDVYNFLFRIYDCDNNLEGNLLKES